MFCDATYSPPSTSKLALHGGGITCVPGIWSSKTWVTLLESTYETPNLLDSSRTYRLWDSRVGRFRDIHILAWDGHASCCGWNNLPVTDENYCPSMYSRLGGWLWDQRGNKNNVTLPNPFFQSITLEGILKTTPPNYYVFTKKLHPVLRPLEWYCRYYIVLHKKQ